MPDQTADDQLNIGKLPGALLGQLIGSLGINDPSVVVGPGRQPGNLILATAIAGGAELIVSGDEIGVLKLQDVEGIPIVMAREALHRLGLIEE